jgi:pectin methylesterase-like acyl-CoA thioesterase
VNVIYDAVLINWNVCPGWLARPPLLSYSKKQFMILKSAKTILLLFALTLADCAGAALVATNLFPATGATNICPDTPLKITFAAPPTATNGGTIRIYTGAGILADTLNLGAPQTRIISGFVFTNYAVIVNSNTASIFPHPGVLTTNQSYYVNIDAGVFSNNVSGAYGGIADSTTWQFTTKPALPPAGTNELVVAADGSADFATVQGAVEFIPYGNTNQTLIFIRNGIYQEIVYMTNKNDLTFRGENRTNTVIEYANNEDFNYKGLTTNVYRQLFGVDANDVALENLSLTNTTPEGGSQAEALRIDGQRCIANYASFHSYQDTLKVSGTVFFKNCYVEGDTDYIWGFGTTYFTNCETKALNTGGFNSQPRNGLNYYGYIFVNCSLTKSNGMATNGFYLGRILSNSHPTCSNACVAFINCKMDNHIITTGWKGDSEPTNNLRLWEYQSTDLTGTNLINVSGRTNISSQLTAAQAAPLIYPTNVFGFVTNNVPTGTGWSPQLAPNIISEPTNQIVSSNQTAIFTVGATGIPDPAFQWYANGAAVASATNSKLTVSNVQPGDTAVYSVVVSNSAGVFTSCTAALVVNPIIPAQLSPGGLAGGEFALSVNGLAGPAYSVQVTTNLQPTQWQTVFTTNSTATPFLWTDTAAPGYPARYYRVGAQAPTNN